MASKVAQAIKRDRERRELVDRIANLEAQMKRLTEQFEQGAAEVAPAKRTRKTSTQEAKTS